MALVSGPRLGVPSKTEINIFAQFDGAVATINLETRVTGASTWVVSDTGTPDGAQLNTIVLQATGLLPGTKYDWRVTEDATERATETTWTLRNGRYVVYFASDQHEDTSSSITQIQRVLATILEDFELNYEPLGIPAFIIQGGDWFTFETNLDDDAMPVILQDAAILETLQRIPMCYMFDDHDWQGNNSGYDRLNGTQNHAQTVAIKQNWWRDRPRPASPSFGFQVEFWGVPWVFMDQRSQKVFGSNRTFVPNDPDTSNFGAAAGAFPNQFGPDQRAWLRDLFQDYVDDRKRMVMIMSSTTFVDSFNSKYMLISPSLARDGISIYHQHERNYVMQPFIDARHDFAHSPIVVLSGDDHATRVRDEDLHFPENYILFEGASPPDFSATEVIRRGTPTNKSTGLRVREFKVVSSGQGDVGASLTPGTQPNVSTWTYDPTKMIFSDQTGSSGTETILRIDVLDGGSTPKARFKLFKINNDTFEEQESDALGRTGEWYFEGGFWQTFSATAVEFDQVYPPDNGHDASFNFKRWYQDDTNGTMIMEDLAGRDPWTWAFREIIDIDEPGLDDLRDGWDIRTEEDLPMPE